MLPPAPEVLLPPTTVLPGDDLTRYVMNPSSLPPPPSSRKKKKSRTNDDGDANADSSSSPNTLPIPKIGTGLHFNPTSRSVTASIAGRLIHRPSSRTWHIASNPKRYAHATVGDRVIGIVEAKASADFYRVNMGNGAHPALMSVLAFEGATKRNRPYLEVGCLVYCRVSRVHGGGKMDPEVSCKVGGDGGGGDDGGASRKDWMTDEGTYGELKGGTVVRIGLGLARELLLPSNVVLAALDASGVPFEVAVGVNGMLWVHSAEPEYTIMIVNAIRNSEVMTPEQVRGMVKALVKTVRAGFEED